MGTERVGQGAALLGGPIEVGISANDNSGFTLSTTNSLPSARQTTEAAKGNANGRYQQGLVETGILGNTIQTQVGEIKNGAFVPGPLTKRAQQPAEVSESEGTYAGPPAGYDNPAGVLILQAPTVDLPDPKAPGQFNTGTTGSVKLLVSGTESPPSLSTEITASGQTTSGTPQQYVTASGEAAVTLTAGTTGVSGTGRTSASVAGGTEIGTIPVFAAATVTTTTGADGGSTSGIVQIGVPLGNPGTPNAAGQYEGGTRDYNAGNIPGNNISLSSDGENTSLNARFAAPGIPVGEHSTLTPDVKASVGFDSGASLTAGVKVQTDISRPQESRGPAKLTYGANVQISADETKVNATVRLEF